MTEPTPRPATTFEQVACADCGARGLAAPGHGAGWVCPPCRRAREGQAPVTLAERSARIDARWGGVLARLVDDPEWRGVGAGQ